MHFRIAYTLLLLVGVCPLAACDSTSEGPPPAICGEITNRSDSILVAVGEVATLDLNALFSGLGAPLAYGAEWDQTEGVPIAGAEVEGSSLSVTGSRVGLRTLYLDARAPCGVVARARVQVRVIPAGTSCDVMPTANPPSLVRLAMGGVPEDLPLFGAGGLFAGPFVESSPVAVDDDGQTVSAVVVSSGPPSIRITPHSVTGSGAVQVTATDVCGRQISVEILYEVIDSPTCTVEYEPLSADYFPLAIGNRWGYGVERWSCPGPTCNPPAAGEEVWEVVAESPCSMGQRTYEVGVTGTGSGFNGTLFADVRGNEVSIRRPSDSTLETWPVMQRFWPPTAPEVVSTIDVECSPPGPGNGGDWCRSFEYSLARGVGVTQFEYEFEPFMASVGIRLQLLEPPGLRSFSWMTP